MKTLCSPSGWPISENDMPAVTKPGLTTMPILPALRDNLKVLRLIVKSPAQEPGSGFQDPVTEYSICSDEDTLPASVGMARIIIDKEYAIHPGQTLKVRYLNPPYCIPGRADIEVIELLSKPATTV